MLNHNEVMDALQEAFPDVKIRLGLVVEVNPNKSFWSFTLSELRQVMSGIKPGDGHPLHHARTVVGKLKRIGEFLRDERDPQYDREREAYIRELPELCSALIAYLEAVQQGDTERIEAVLDGMLPENQRQPEPDPRIWMQEHENE